MDRLQSELQDLFRRVFDQDDLTITESTTAAEVDGWDSMAHINLIIAVEKQFGIKFTGSEIAGMRGANQNVGHLLRIVAAKTGREAGQ